MEDIYTRVRVKGGWRIEEIEREEIKNEEYREKALLCAVHSNSF